LQTPGDGGGAERATGRERDRRGQLAAPGELEQVREQQHEDRRCGQQKARQREVPGRRLETAAQERSGAGTPARAKNAYRSAR